MCTTARSDQGEGEDITLTHMGPKQHMAEVLHMLYEELSTAIAQQITKRNRFVIGMFKQQ